MLFASPAPTPCPPLLGSPPPAGWLPVGFGAHQRGTLPLPGPGPGGDVSFPAWDTGAFLQPRCVPRGPGWSSEFPHYMLSMGSHQREAGEGVGAGEKGVLTALFVFAPRAPPPAPPPRRVMFDGIITPRVSRHQEAPS